LELIFTVKLMRLTGEKESVSNRDCGTHALRYQQRREGSGSISVVGTAGLIVCRRRTLSRSASSLSSSGRFERRSFSRLRVAMVGLAVVR
jgi:hypothetical protein